MNKRLLEEVLIKLAEVGGLLNQVNMPEGMQVPSLDGEAEPADKAIEQVQDELYNGGNGLIDRVKGWIKLL